MPRRDAVDAAVAGTAAVSEFIHDYETKWLDEPIPALANHTPRQAADPIRRDDLIMLIDSFPSTGDNSGAMDPARLRQALGLP